MINAPQRNLGAGDPWGRWVENIIDKTSKAVVQLEQSVQRAFIGINGTLRQLSGQVTEIGNRAELSTTQHTTTGWSLVNGTTSILTTTVFVPENRTRASIFASLTGYAVINASGAQWESSANITIGGSTQECSLNTVSGGTLFALIGGFSQEFFGAAGQEIPISVSITVPGNVTTTPASNRCTLDLIISFAN